MNLKTSSNTSCGQWFLAKDAKVAVLATFGDGTAGKNFSGWTQRLQARQSTCICFHFKSLRLSGVELCNLCPQLQLRQAIPLKMESQMKKNWWKWWLLHILQGPSWLFPPVPGSPACACQQWLVVSASWLQSANRSQESRDRRLVQSCTKPGKEWHHSKGLEILTELLCYKLLYHCQRPLRDLKLHQLHLFALGFAHCKDLQSWEAEEGENLGRTKGFWRDGTLWKKTTVYNTTKYDIYIYIQTNTRYIYNVYTEYVIYTIYYIMYMRNILYNKYNICTYIHVIMYIFSIYIHTYIAYIWYIIRIHNYIL